MKRANGKHRNIMQNILGRELNSDDVVHHIDGNHLNNDPYNLFLCVNAQMHIDCHILMKKRPELYEYIFKNI